MQSSASFHLSAPFMVFKCHVWWGRGRQRYLSCHLGLQHLICASVLLLGALFSVQYHVNTIGKGADAVSDAWDPATHGITGSLLSVRPGIQHSSQLGN